MRPATGGAAAALGIAIAAVGIGVAARAQTAPPASAATGQDLQVVVSYKGKGEVGKANEITVFLFDTPMINAQAKPIALQVVEKNGGTATFKGLTAATVYIAVAYDDKGTFVPGQGPPPPGTPVAIHGEGKTGSGAVGVKPGKGAKVAITFSDTTRMQ